MNSSLEQLQQCLAAYENIVARGKDRPVAEVNAAFRAKLQSIDPAIFSNLENWWAVVYEQLQYDEE